MPENSGFHRPRETSRGAPRRRPAGDPKSPGLYPTRGLASTRARRARARAQDAAADEKKIATARGARGAPLRARERREATRANSQRDGAAPGPAKSFLKRRERGAALRACRSRPGRAREGGTNGHRNRPPPGRSASSFAPARTEPCNWTHPRREKRNAPGARWESAPGAAHAAAGSQAELRCECATDLPSEAGEWGAWERLPSRKCLSCVSAGTGFWRLQC